MSRSGKICAKRAVATRSGLPHWGYAMHRVIFLWALAAATPAFANTSTAIPEPGDLGLFALAVVGLIIGRSISRRPPSANDRDDDA